MLFWARRSIAKTFGRYGCFPVAGVIGDVDGDGELDQVAIVNNEGEMYGGTVNKVRIIKMNVLDAVKTRGRYRSKVTTYVSEEMRNGLPRTVGGGGSSTPAFLFVHVCVWLINLVITPLLWHL